MPSEKVIVADDWRNSHLIIEVLSRKRIKRGPLHQGSKEEEEEKKEAFIFILP